MEKQRRTTTKSNGGEGIGTKRKWNRNTTPKLEGDSVGIIRNFKNKKTPELTTITTEIIKTGGEIVLERIYTLIKQI